MSLKKNDIPILEYDTDSKAVIMPGHSTDFHFTEKAVMLFMETEIDDYVGFNDREIIGQLLFTADSLVNTDEHDIRNWGNDIFSIAMDLALDAAAKV